MFGVCLTFYIIIIVIVINKEKIYSIFQTPLRYYVPPNLVCRLILREGCILWKISFPCKTLTSLRNSPAN